MPLERLYANGTLPRHSRVYHEGIVKTAIRQGHISVADIHKARLVINPTLRRELRRKLIGTGSDLASRTGMAGHFFGELRRAGVLKQAGPGKFVLAKRHEPELRRIFGK